MANNHPKVEPPPKTGWPPGLLQDDCKGLSQWFASRPDARLIIRKLFMGKRIIHPTTQELELAKDRHCIGSDNEIEIDGDARVSRGEDGAWVQAWVFVPKELITDYKVD